MRFTIWIVYMLAVMVWQPGTGRGNTDLPHEFDSLVPVFETAQHIGTRYTRDSVTVRFTARDAFERIATFYKQALGKAGWKISKIGTGKGLAAANDRINLSLIENPDPQGFTIKLYYPGGRE